VGFKALRDQIRVKIWTMVDETWSGSVESHHRSYLRKAKIRRYRERTVVVELQVNFLNSVTSLMLTVPKPATIANHGRYYGNVH